MSIDFTQAGDTASPPYSEVKRMVFLTFLAVAKMRCGRRERRVLAIRTLFSSGFDRVLWKFAEDEHQN